MQKKLVIINGTMGVGKTATSKELYKKLNNSVWLDGDWCWMMNPFDPTDYNKKMVVDNITYLLRNFLINPSLEYVVFNWVIHMEEIYDLLLKELEDIQFDVYKVTLICSEEELERRILRDIENGERDEDCVKKGLERLHMYKQMNTIKFDTSNKKISDVVEEIIEAIA